MLPIVRASVAEGSVACVETVRPGGVMCEGTLAPAGPYRTTVSSSAGRQQFHGFGRAKKGKIREKVIASGMHDDYYTNFIPWKMNSCHSSV